MTTIPRRLAYRVLAQVLHGQARAVEGRTARRSGERRGPQAQADAAAKGRDRSDQIAELRYQAQELSRRIGDPRYYHGPGLDPALVGWLAVLALGMTEVRAEITRLTPAGSLESVDWFDVPAVCDRLMPTEGGG
jgi:hypothetical protein